ncbi:UDP-N-acetylmuramate dehydrogenase [Vibrio japonicus]|uniref:UDP-N-acetylenolpyruvoylglucosamine reductase n=1 Tax=Vibrio japonicus TaxID=1824638 RepID=A0ABY5LM71_9VIBR|nr:UDP-N-acetylmuramate dehydrogenase [Vibrio japonicus]UUM31878.1 UDP-N-acetylmuramate dehydrogenase [Vibrio japonicus]
MQILTDADLSAFHTFSISQSCAYLAEIHSVQDLISAYQNPDWQTLPKLMLGKGSNILFTQPFQGVVLVNRLLGKRVSESESHWHLHIEAGEDWPSLVEWSVNQGYAGLENLALIPGCAGSAPIQNIGAYGIELKDVCEYVDILFLDTLETKRLAAQECKFGYRDSIFKQDLYQKAVVTAIGLKLAKDWQPNIEYGPLKSFDKQSVTAKQVFDRVSQIRMEKLPDPAVTGNAGSFFKNPVISQLQYESLKTEFPEMVAYPTDNGVKIAAGWLIDQCGLKGETVNGAQVHPNQALVLVNKGNASANDVIELASLVRSQVQDKYGITLEHEVRFISELEETNLTKILEQRQ